MLIIYNFSLLLQVSTIKQQYFLFSKINPS